MFNVATQQHFAKTEKVAAVEGGSEATEIVEVSGYNLGCRKITRFLLAFSCIINMLTILKGLGIS